MANIDYKNAQTNTTVQGHLEGAIIKRARTILSEPASTPNHELRVAKAIEVLRNGVQLHEWIRWAVTHPVAAAKITTLALTEAEVDQVVDETWNIVCGIYPGA